VLAPALLLRRGRGVGRRRVLVGRELAFTAWGCFPSGCGCGCSFSSVGEASWTKRAEVAVGRNACCRRGSTLALLVALVVLVVPVLLVPVLVVVVAAKRGM